MRMGLINDRKEWKVWTVSELTLAIRDNLVSRFPFISVEGEVSNCKASGAGHIYFTLKDQKAVIEAVLFRGQAARMSVKPAEGMRLMISGKIDVYPPRGGYQIVVEKLQETGIGLLLEAIERRKVALAAQGLFDPARKRNLPLYPRRLAVVTSRTGAALRDILRVLKRRSAAPRVVILPTAVQGADAAKHIATQLTRASAYNLGEVVILARGGGSREDLMPFNEEVVVRAVADSALPVICGVGHEIDVSLADYAADVRAATPSAAAELVSHQSEVLLKRSREFRKDCAFAMDMRLEEMRGKFNMSHAAHLIRGFRSRLEESMRRSDDANRMLKSVTLARLTPLRRRLELAGRSLADASPQGVMERGYACVRLKNIAIHNAAQLSEDDQVELRFAKGRADARITTVHTISGDKEQHEGI